jgi:hypothetical protein
VTSVRRLATKRQGKTAFLARDARKLCVMPLKKQIVFIFSVVFGALLFLAIVALVFKPPSRKLILLQNGVPMANLKGSYMPDGVGNAPLLQTSTDAQGRLDIHEVSEASNNIRLELRNDTSAVYAGIIQLPKSGSRTVDMCGKRTKITTVTTYFGFFHSTESCEWIQN